MLIATMVTQATSAAALLAVLAAAFCALPSDAFVILPAVDRLAIDQSSPSTLSIARSFPFSHASSVTGTEGSTTSLYMAADGKKKRRRKRKDGATPSVGSDPSPAVPIVSDDGDLPGFDLGDDEQVEEFKTEQPTETPTKAATTAMEAAPENAAPSDPSDVSVDMSNPKVMEAMKGSMPGVGSIASMEDLLRNRDLEKAFEFDGTAVKEDLPSLGQLSGKKGRGGSSSSGAESSAPSSSPVSFVVEQKVGSKRARAEARRAAAIEAERAAEEEKSFLEKIPQILDEKGEVSPIKILEQGTWIGIGILVLWEVYINSPLFSRTAPMTPVVFEILF